MWPSCIRSDSTNNGENNTENTVDRTNERPQSYNRVMSLGSVEDQAAAANVARSPDDISVIERGLSSLFSSNVPIRRLSSLPKLILKPHPGSETSPVARTELTSSSRIDPNLTKEQREAMAIKAWSESFPRSKNNSTPQNFLKDSKLLSRIVKNIQRGEAKDQFMNNVAGLVNLDAFVKQRTEVLNLILRFADGHNLEAKTMELAIAYAERALCTFHPDSKKDKMLRNNLKILAMAACWTAAKVEEIYPPSLHHFAKMAGNAARVQHVNAVEGILMEVLDWYISFSTPSDFVATFGGEQAVHMANKRGQTDEHCAIRFFIDVGLVSVFKNGCNCLSATEMAAAAVILGKLLICDVEGAKSACEKARSDGNLSYADVERATHFIWQYVFPASREFAPRMLGIVIRKFSGKKWKNIAKRTIPKWDSVMDVLKNTEKTGKVIIETQGNVIGSMDDFTC